jgi:hypothetical protein
MVFSNFCTSTVVRDRKPAFQRTDTTNQVVKDTLVERSLVSSALPELLVVVVQAWPVFSELLEAVFVDVAQAVAGQQMDNGGEQFTYTLEAHLVTLRPSFKQSSSPFPLASALHIM